MALKDKIFQNTLHVFIAVKVLKFAVRFTRWPIYKYKEYEIKYI